MDTLFRDCFIKREDIDSVIEYSNLKKDPLAATKILMWEDFDILFVEDDGFLVGIITFGDYINDEDNEIKDDIQFINRSFRSVSDRTDVAGILEIKRLIPTISTIPVVNDNRLIGVINIKEGRSESYKEIIRDWFRRRFERETINHLISRCIDAQVFFYNPPSLKEIEEYEPGITELISERFRRYRRDASVLFFDRIDKKNWESFYGKDGMKEKHPEIKSVFSSLETRISEGFLFYEDYAGKNINFKNGYRDTSKIKDADKRIIVFGPCFVLGSYVVDSDTLTYQLERIIENHNIEGYSVKNCGALENYIYKNILKEDIGPSDIVIICADTKRDLSKFESETFHYMGSLSKSYESVGKPSDCMIDNPAHCNGKVLKNMANIMFRDIESFLKPCDCIGGVNTRKRLKDRLPFYFESAYFESFIKHYHIDTDPYKKTGAIVMNCNPFTLGHRYLIEQASKCVERLIIFVAEENKSKFNFCDRINMVKMGTQDIENVEVYPSGELIISQKTFFDYFEKDTIIDPVAPEYDVRLFGEIVAKELNITYRFVGEEPFDSVTKKYNETMKDILPNYGVEVVEIARKETKNNIISASLVRKCIENKDYLGLRELLPESTMEFLTKANYI